MRRLGAVLSAGLVSEENTSAESQRVWHLGSGLRVDGASQEEEKKEEGEKQEEEKREEHEEKTTTHSIGCGAHIVPTHEDEVESRTPQREDPFDALLDETYKDEETTSTTESRSITARVLAQRAEALQTELTAERGQRLDFGLTRKNRMMQRIAEDQQRALDTLIHKWQQGVHQGEMARTVAWLAQDTWNSRVAELESGPLRRGARGGRPTRAKPHPRVRRGMPPAATRHARPVRAMRSQNSASRTRGRVPHGNRTFKTRNNPEEDKPAQRKKEMEILESRLASLVKSAEEQVDTLKERRKDPETSPPLTAAPSEGKATLAFDVREMLQFLNDIEAEEKILTKKYGLHRADHPPPKLDQPSAVNDARLPPLSQESIQRFVEYEKQSERLANVHRNPLPHSVLENWQVAELLADQLLEDSLEKVVGEVVDVCDSYAERILLGELGENRM